MTLLDVENLSVTLNGTPLLRDVSVQVGAGETLAIVGESGSGKSLTAMAIMGMLPAGAQVAGQVRFDGTDLLPLPDSAMCVLRGHRIGMVFQEPMTALNPLMTIGAQVAEPLVLHGHPRSAARTIAQERLERVGLPQTRFPLRLYPHELSGGQRQRVAIAMAIAAGPRLLIADEPTTALDVTTQAGVLDLLGGLVRDTGMGMILITHDLAVAAQMADRIVVMQNGTVVESGPTAQVLNAPQAEYTRALIEASVVRPAPAPPPIGPMLLDVSHARRSYRLPRTGLFAAPPVLHAVDDVSLTIAQGEAVGLVGQSGCGKSTLTRAILGLDALNGGAITLMGTPVTPRMPRMARAPMQVVFQDPFGSFDPRQRVADLVAEPFHLTTRPTDWRNRVAQVLTDVGLTDGAMERYIHEFSGGQRQRIAIARALITRPRLVILDEAVSALDVRVRAQILSLLARLRQDQGLAYLFISHDLSVVRAVTDRCLVMDGGRIVEQGPTEQLFARPTHPVTQALIRAIPRMERTTA